MLISKEFTFDAAHSLPNVVGGHPCGQLHGHTYTVVVYIEGMVNHPCGWVVDYAELKQAVQPLIDEFDHSNLNGIIDNPTAEKIAMHLWDVLEGKLSKLKDFADKRAWLRAVKVKETRGTSATYEGREVLHPDYRSEE